MLRTLTILSLALGFLTVSNTGHKTVETASASGRCPLIYAPVVCDGGKTYPNQCVADQHHAKNCVPAGQL
jgi:hypothetical protein